MRNFTKARAFRSGGAALTIAPVAGLALALSACGGVPSNRSMNSVHVPVVEKVSYTLDVSTGGSGLAYGEESRLEGWFGAMGLKYGDQVYVDDPTGNGAARDAVASLAARRGITVSGGSPETAGYVTGGMARVVIVRTRATVPGCPEWSTDSDFNPNNGLSSNYGCATNTNIAAMVANPEDLLRGQNGTGETTVMSSTKAIDAYRKAEPTGNGNSVSKTGSKGD